MTGGNWWWSPIIIHRFSRLKPSWGFYWTGAKCYREKPCPALSKHSPRPTRPEPAFLIAFTPAVLRYAHHGFADILPAQNMPSFNFILDFCNNQVNKEPNTNHRHFSTTKRSEHPQMPSLCHREVTGGHFWFTPATSASCCRQPEVASSCVREAFWDWWEASVNSGELGVASG